MHNVTSHDDRDDDQASQKHREWLSILQMPAAVRGKVVNAVQAMQCMCINMELPARVFHTVHSLALQGAPAGLAF